MEGPPTRETLMNVLSKPCLMIYNSNVNCIVLTCYVKNDLLVK